MIAASMTDGPAILDEAVVAERAVISDRTMMAARPGMAHGSAMAAVTSTMALRGSRSAGEDHPAESECQCGGSNMLHAHLQLMSPLVSKMWTKPVYSHGINHP